MNLFVVNSGNLLLVKSHLVSERPDYPVPDDHLFPSRFPAHTGQIQILFHIHLSDLYWLDFYYNEDKGFR